MRKTSVEAQSAQGECRRHVTVIRGFIVLSAHFFILFYSPVLNPLYILCILHGDLWFVPLDRLFHPSISDISTLLHCYCYCYSNKIIMPSHLQLSYPFFFPTVGALIR